MTNISRYLHFVEGFSEGDIVRCHHRRHSCPYPTQEQKVKLDVRLQMHVLPKIFEIIKTTL